MPAVQDDAVLALRADATYLYRFARRYPYRAVKNVAKTVAMSLFVSANFIVGNMRQVKEAPYVIPGFSITQPETYTISTRSLVRDAYSWRDDMTSLSWYNKGFTWLYDKVPLPQSIKPSWAEVTASLPGLKIYDLAGQFRNFALSPFVRYGEGRANWDRGGVIGVLDWIWVEAHQFRFSIYPKMLQDLSENDMVKKGIELVFNAFPVSKRAIEDWVQEQHELSNNWFVVSFASLVGTLNSVSYIGLNLINGGVYTVVFAAIDVGDYAYRLLGQAQLPQRTMIMLRDAYALIKAPTRLALRQ